MNIYIYIDIDRLRGGSNNEDKIFQLRLLAEDGFSINSKLSSTTETWTWAELGNFILENKDYL